MFTGIVEELGTVAAYAPHSAGARITITCGTVLNDLTLGASIAVNGACLTAVDITADSFSADLAPETLARTNLGSLIPGARVNLERPVTPTTRLSGHIVQGHVDGTGEFLSIDELGDDNYWIRVRVPAALTKYLVEKGSITLDGISLTIARVEADNVFGVTIIPHTFLHTNLGHARPGTRINVEVDVLAKHVEQLLKFRP
jgi:riboflavin synthase